MMDEDRGEDRDDELDDELWRIERNIVAYDDETLGVEGLTADAVRDWLDKRELPFFVPFVVESVDGDAFLAATGEDGPPLFQGHELVDGEVRRYWRAWRPPATDAESWFAAGPEGGVARQWISGRAEDGSTVTEYAGDYVWDVDDVAPHVSDASAGARLLAVGLAGTPTRIVFPVAETVLHLVVDGDGSMMRVEAEWAVTHGLRQGLEDSFNEKWADWLDQDHPLDQALVSTTIAALEAEISQLKAEEEQ